MSRTLVVAVTVSLGVHVAVVLLLFVLVGEGTPGPFLFVDLTREEPVPPPLVTAPGRPPDREATRGSVRGAHEGARERLTRSPPPAPPGRVAVPRPRPDDPSPTPASDGEKEETASVRQDEPPVPLRVAAPQHAPVSVAPGPSTQPPAQVAPPGSSGPERASLSMDGEHTRQAARAAVDGHVSGGDRPAPRPVTPNDAGAVRPAPDAAANRTDATPGADERSAARRGAGMSAGGDVGRDDPLAGRGLTGPARPGPEGERGFGGEGAVPPATGSGAGQAQEGGGAVSRGMASIGSGGGPGHDEAYGPYLAFVRRRLQEMLQYPLGARRRKLSGTVHVELTLRADGSVEDVKVAASSSHPLLDDAAVEAVRRLPPVPFPSGLAPRPIRARVPVVFELR